MNDMSLETFCARIGHDLKQLRRHRGLSQTQAAERVGIARQTLSKIECGDMGVAMGTIISLARLYQAPESFLRIMGVEAINAPRSAKSEPDLTL